jgi:hypothetical protein
MPTDHTRLRAFLDPAVGRYGMRPGVTGARDRLAMGPRRQRCELAQVARGPQPRGNVYARFALGIPVRDATADFRADRADVLAAMDLTTMGFSRLLLPG